MASPKQDRLGDPTGPIETWTDDGPSLGGPAGEKDPAGLNALLDATLGIDGDPHVGEGPLGRGGMGEVVVAEDLRLRRRVALKRLEISRMHELRSVAAFIQEARLAARLDHPNIVPVFELGRQPGRGVFFTMKYVNGQDLASIVRGSPVAERDHEALLDLVDVLIKVCDALASAHAEGIVHCDIKPHNIMVGDYGAVYLVDWGLARQVEAQRLRTGAPTDGEPRHGYARGARGHAGAAAASDESTKAERFEPGRDEWLQLSEDGEQISGTPAYMSPEQARGLPLGPASDIFSLGCVLYFILTGVAPYASDSQRGALVWAERCAFSNPSDVVPDVPVGLEQIVLRAMSEDPDDRYPSIEDFRRDLVEYSRSGGDFPRIRVRAGDYIVREGEQGDRAFIIVSGRCEVTQRDADGREQLVSEMGAGEVFGETSILAELPRTASVRALEDTELMEVQGEIFEREVARMTPWMGAFMRTLAQRLARR